MNPLFDTLPEPLRGDVVRASAAWDEARSTSRIWARDASVWTGSGEEQWLGWLDAPVAAAAGIPDLQAFAAEVQRDGFTDVLLLGMGGSSLCPEVLAESFSVHAGRPRLHVLDSTDPDQIRAFDARLDLARTLVIVASKSGTTLEPSILQAHFAARLAAVVGERDAGRHLVAITDPGSALEQSAARSGFRRIFRGVPSIGGRYSALSPFGLVPAAVMGLDLPRWVDAAARMAKACGPERGIAENPGAALGVAIGTAARQGLDKLTLIVSPRIYDLGAWLEQLIAESTGKRGLAVIPVDREPVGPPDAYGPDRLFAYIRLESDANDERDAAVEALVRAGRPVMRVDVEDLYGLAAEFFRWEFATAVAGAVLGINPFDQPDVEASKVETRKLTAEIERHGELPPETPALVDGRLTLFADGRNADALSSAARGATAAAWMSAHLARIGAGDYFAVLAYVPMTAAHERVLTRLRTRVRDATRAATCVGFGPRFLHSTGQAYKGGPNSGVFLQVTNDPAEDLPVPGTKYTFGAVKAAQARGDFQVLADRDRRALRVHLGPDVQAGLEALDALVASAFGAR
ncbi:MAG TPA: bifunctional transaldolase/phosoglucose isomerase [Vicinamibacterales bacterium]